MGVDASAAAPPGYPAADVTTVIVDKHWAAAHKAHMARRNEMHAHNQNLGATSPPPRDREVK